MATTHDIRYEAEERDQRSRVWSWLLPLAVLILAALALSSYLANRDNPSTELNSGLNTIPSSPSTEVLPY